MSKSNQSNWMKTFSILAIFTMTVGLTTACSKTDFNPSSNSQTQSPGSAQGTDPVAVVPAPQPNPLPNPLPEEPIVVNPTPAPTPVPLPAPTPVPPQPPVAVNPPPQTCTPVGTITRLTKLLFLVDGSGSNGSGNNGTDPGKKFRLGSIQNFLNKYSYKKNFQWGFITFAGTTAQDYVGNRNKLSFTTSPSVMTNAINSFYNKFDTGNTPYGAALTAATSAIANDPDHNSVLDPQYFVIMLTDGYPTDFHSINDSTTYVNKLLLSAPSEVNLSTIFYGPQNFQSSINAIALLSGMAKLGSGQFANVNDPKTGINIEDLIPIPGVPCQ